jgi:hypothetical protein
MMSEQQVTFPAPLSSDLATPAAIALLNAGIAWLQLVGFAPSLSPSPPDNQSVPPDENPTPP